jgi:hypothetical protein
MNISFSRYSFLVTLVYLSLLRTPSFASPSIADCSIYPADNYWNTPVNSLPVDTNSGAYVNSIGSDASLHPDFGAGLYDGGPIGIPYVVVSGAQSKVSVSFDYSRESDPGPYPVPLNAPIEGGANISGDRHVLILDRDNCKLYELFSAYPQPDGSWRAGSGAIFDLKSNSLRPRGWTSADAAGFAILPGLVRYDEIEASEIKHAIRFTAPRTRNQSIWPARHYASSLTGTQFPPVGQRFRLKAGYDISIFSPQVQVVLRAMKKYGIVLADNGSAWFISGEPDDRWNNDVLRELRQVKGSNFEAVDVTPLIVDQDSGQTKISVLSAPSVPQDFRIFDGQ